ncbi:GNAT family N-acetyltransferase [Virgibacillus ihumii]|uniref:GNAT family N-acetyltransferase n=1 Tax=Virgibacillus ihumii TaxID=2686091 RepID=UPI00157CAA71|nr:GNAT family N-acetyltransferase [Virgibacillus ihumii]
MKIKLELAVDYYIQQVEPLLLKKEACNNLMLGILGRIKETPDAYENGYCLGIVEQENEAVFAFMQTPPNNWILAAVDRVPDDVIQKVALFIFNKRTAVPGVLGPIEEAEMFKSEWERLSNVGSSIHVKQLIYRLDDVNPLPEVEGELRHATQYDCELVKNWLVQFGVEANEPVSNEYAVQLASSFIGRSSLYLWEVDGVPVSMANQSRKTRNGSTINAVFTPDEYKRNGFATATVATLSSKLLAEGSGFCSLYTDLDNPDSNSIYRKIGYYEVGKSIVYEFKA